MIWLNFLSAYTQMQLTPQESIRVSGAAAEGVLPAGSKRNAAPCWALRAALFFCIPLEIAPGTFSWEENQKTPVTAGSWCLNSKRTDGRVDEGSCIPAYRTHRLVKACLGINKVCLEEKWVMFCGVTKWIRHAVDVLSRNFQGSWWPHPGGFFSPFKLARQLNMLKWCMYNWLKLSSLVGLKYKGIKKEFLWNCRYVCRVLF